MANPYGITEVNIPALLGMHQQRQRQRIEDLYRAREYEREERKDQREEEMRTAYRAAFASPPAGPQAQPSAITDASPTPGGMVQPDTASPIFRPDPAALRALMATGPEGVKAAQAITQMSADQMKSAQEAATRGLELTGRVVGGVRALPPEQRNAAYQVERMNLQRMGVDISTLPAQWDESVADQIVQQSMKTAEALGLRMEAQRFAETAQHNRAMEANAAGNLNVARGNLDVARGRLGVAQGALDVARNRAGGDNSDLDYLMGGR